MSQKSETDEPALLPPLDEARRPVSVARPPAGRGGAGRGRGAARQQAGRGDVSAVSVESSSEETGKKQRPPLSNAQATAKSYLENLYNSQTGQAVQVQLDDQSINEVNNSFRDLEGYLGRAGQRCIEEYSRWGQEFWKSDRKNLFEGLLNAYWSRANIVAALRKKDMDRFKMVRPFPPINQQMQLGFDDGWDLVVQQFGDEINRFKTLFRTELGHFRYVNRQLQETLAFRCTADLWTCQVVNDRSEEFKNWEEMLTKMIGKWSDKDKYYDTNLELFKKFMLSPGMENWNRLIADLVLWDYQKLFFGTAELQPRALNFYTSKTNAYLHEERFNGGQWNGKWNYPMGYDVMIRLFSLEDRESVRKWDRINDYLSSREEEDQVNLLEYLADDLDDNFAFLDAERAPAPGEESEVAKELATGQPISSSEQKSQETAKKKRKQQKTKPESEESRLWDDPPSEAILFSKEGEAQPDNSKIMIKAPAIMRLIAKANLADNDAQKLQHVVDLRTQLAKEDDFGRFISTLCQVKDAKSPEAALQAIADFSTSGSMDVDERRQSSAGSQQQRPSRCAETFPDDFTDDQMVTLDIICGSAGIANFIIAPVSDLNALQDAANGKIRGVVQSFRVNFEVQSKAICDVDAGVKLADAVIPNSSRVWAAVDKDTAKILGFVALVNLPGAPKDLLIQQICATESRVASHLIAYALAYLANKGFKVVAANLPTIVVNFGSYRDELGPTDANIADQTLIAVAQTNVACWYFSLRFKSTFPLELLSKTDIRGGSLQELRSRFLNESPRRHKPEEFGADLGIFDERRTVVLDYPDQMQIRAMAKIKPPQCNVLVAEQPAQKKTRAVPE